MSTSRFALSDYHRLSESERQACLRGLAEAAKQPLDGELDELNAEIAAFETRYEMTSETLLQRLREGSVDHTADICHWQMLLELRDRVRQIS